MVFSLVKTHLQKWCAEMINDTLKCIRISHMSWWVDCSGSGGGVLIQDNRFGVGCHHQWDFRWPRNEPNMAHYNIKNRKIRPLPHMCGLWAGVEVTLGHNDVWSLLRIENLRTGDKNFQDQKDVSHLCFASFWLLMSVTQTGFSATDKNDEHESSSIKKKIK